MSNKPFNFTEFFSDLTDLTGNDGTRAPSVQQSTNSNTSELKDRVETRLMSLWHNMRYGWNIKVRTNFNKESPIWILGRCYHQRASPKTSACAINDNLSTINNDNNSKLLTTSLHEELPTSCDSYMRSHQKCRSANDLSEKDIEIDDQAFEPPEETAQDVIGEFEEGFDGFKRDFISKIWMTYRRDFAVMQTDLKTSPNSPTSGYTSDCGWGCMIRSGQMMLANALIIHFLGRCWRFDPDNLQPLTTEDNIHRKIIRWFGDQESKNSPFSIHKMVELGKKAGKRVGEWYGPCSVAHILKEAVKLATKENIDLASLHIYIAQDCTIYNQDIFDECYSKELQTVPWQKCKSSPVRRNNVITFKHLILLIPLKLGQEKLNEIYGDCLKAMLSLEWCIGIIGGRPKHSLYFLGYQDDKLIHLDPHYCQDLVDVNVEHFPLSSFHCKTARKMKISKMDPSCCLGFYIPTRSEYDRFQSTIQPYLQPLRRNYQPSRNCHEQSSYPMFIFHSGRMNDQTDCPQSSASFRMRNLYFEDTTHPNDDPEDDGIEDFVIL